MNLDRPAQPSQAATVTSCDMGNVPNALDPPPVADWASYDDVPSALQVRDAEE
ncbi:hypothetical protein [Streptomyces sp. GESEQ-35]|uniref:hypothetical protein n=1 Tax=Streptomyces sp. GESEQ-35 TaxID=2812657 RepID=UPI001B342DE7|nr:hypothetical protein [Streptomyces sp. GESEQ-35]